MRHLLFSIAFLAGLLGASQSQARNKTLKEWTFLIYLNGNNSLDSFAQLNLNQMEKIGSTDKINVVVQWASLERGHTQRLLVQKDNDPEHVTSPIVQDVGNVDMGDYHSLIDFIKWGVANYPAQHYFIDVWDHGNGWHLENMEMKPFGFDGSSALQPMDISVDDNTKHFFTTKELGMALNEAARIIGHKVDIYGSDACLMAMPEVAAEMADSVSIYAGSEEVEPAAGWPYDTLLEQWNALPNANAIQIGQILTDAYVNSYENGSNGTSDVTFSVFDLSQFKKLNQSVITLGKELMALDSDGRTNALQAMFTTQTYTLNDYGDLVDFTNQLNLNKTAVRMKALSAVNKAVGKFVLANRVTPRFANSHGVSIWLPNTRKIFNKYWSKYSQLAFEQKTLWGETLRSLLEAN